MENLLKFDTKLVKTVPIEQVKTNDYNPKEKKGAKYEKVLDSVRTNGLMAPIFVRELGKDSYEIVDGEQRFTACQDLGLTEVIIYNYGKLTDAEAMALTVWWEEQVPFDEIKLAELFTKLVNEVGGDYSKIKLPFSQKEIEQKIEMLKFDWTAIEKEAEDVKKENHADAVKCPYYGCADCHYFKTGEANREADEEDELDDNYLPDLGN